MIRMDRGAEPAILLQVRIDELARVGSIAANKAPTSDEIGVRYSVVREELWKSQFYKCCFCDFKVQHPYNDVEHYRPKAEADRMPGSADKSGYWWLAWTWENLMFSCAPCNRSHKRGLFPLRTGSTPLAAHQMPPGKEIPLLIDPFFEDPIDHIQFRLMCVRGREHWLPFPRSGSIKGATTIKVAGLDQPRLIDHYDEHIEHYVMPRIQNIRIALLNKNLDLIKNAWNEETKQPLHVRLAFAALSYDALDQLLVPETIRLRHDLVLKRPGR